MQTVLKKVDQKEMAHESKRCIMKSKDETTWILHVYKYNYSNLSMSLLLLVRHYQAITLSLLESFFSALLPMQTSSMLIRAEPHPLLTTNYTFQNENRTN